MSLREGVWRHVRTVIGVGRTSCSYFGQDRQERGQGATGNEHNGFAKDVAMVSDSSKTVI
jgi:hypothetical protein